MLRFKWFGLLAGIYCLLRFNSPLVWGNDFFDSLNVAVNGQLLTRNVESPNKIFSANARYWCQYEIGQVSDEMRQLKNLQFFEGDQLLFTLDEAPGADLSISNAGLIVFFDMKAHFKNEITLIFYSSKGHLLDRATFKGASLFGFSPKGLKFGVGSGEKLEIISVLERRKESYEKCLQFDISEDENWLATAQPGKAKVYFQGKLLKAFSTGFQYPRKIKISSTDQIVAIIDKRQLQVYSLNSGQLLFTDSLPAQYAFRDLLIKSGQIITGIHHRTQQFSKGILRRYNLRGQVLEEKAGSSKSIAPFNRRGGLKKNAPPYPDIPWPFMPFDQVHTVWNYYEQHMGGYGSEYSYLHQGLDIITPIGEPAYAVAPGIVKCVLTIGGPKYWRLAISPEQSPGYSQGWLYAHLIESTIQFDVGDTVQKHDYLGNIIQWSGNWGHIHFVQIEDSGLVWRYDDNEWGITHNPLLSLRPRTDLIPPVIEPVFSHSKFAFCLNETSIYLEPDSLHGAIDIIVKTKDYIGTSPWQLPAFETYYWIIKIPEADTILSRRLGQILNHAYSFYDSDYYEPYATLIYKRDHLLKPSSWMNSQRNYYQILTNNNGDSLAELSEKALAFNTAAYPDGQYRIYVEARDVAGNATIDSMNVALRNGLISATKAVSFQPTSIQLMRNYPNPFNNSTRISYQIHQAGLVQLDIFNAIGQKIQTLVNEFQAAGEHTVIFNANQLASGVFWCRLQHHHATQIRKIIHIR